VGHTSWTQEGRQKNFQGGGGNEKRLKNSKKHRKIALLSLNLLGYICTMYKNPGWQCPPASGVARVPCALG